MGARVWVRGKVPLLGDIPDETEIDLRIGSMLCEAKLTEGDFTTSSLQHVLRYRDVEEVFDLERLTSGGKVMGYQLIRNVLATYAHGGRFIVLCDSRRPDLIREWWFVHSAIRDSDLRYRCSLLLWQELAASLAGEVQALFEVKYGINEYAS